MMRWGSFDPFTIDDPFWQDKMGMPVANKEFLRSLLSHGTFDSYHFFCADSQHVQRFRKVLHEMAPGPAHSKAKIYPQALSLEHLEAEPVDVMHNGDFTFYMPYLIELRNRMPIGAQFAITGVTHSLDTVSLYPKFLQVLLADPRPFDAIICTSQCAVDMLGNTFEHMRETFAARYGAKLPNPPALVKIPLGLPEESYTPQSRVLCRQKLGIHPDHFVMLSLARFSPRRKMDLSPVLECLAWLEEQQSHRTSFPPFTLVLAGAGKSADLALVQSMIDKLHIRSQVRLEANVPSERKKLLYGAADVFLSFADNYQETFGLTILEAMAQGLPVVATEFNGYKELVCHGQTGLLIPTYASSSHEPWEALSGILDQSVLRFYRAQKIAFDMDKLAEALRLLASSPATRKDMGDRARAHAQNFQWPSILRQYEDLWRNLGKEAGRWATTFNRSNSGHPILTPSTQVSFGHYPSRALNLDDTLTLSAYGADRAATGFRPVMYEEVSLLLNQKCLDALTDYVRNNSCTIGSLLEQVRRQFGFPLEIIMLHIDWLWKHGFFRTSGKTRMGCTK